MSSDDSNDQSTLQSLMSSSHAAMDRIYPAQKRADLQTKMKTYTLRNPKLSALIFVNILLTGPPILLFTLYSLTVFLFSFSAVLITTFVMASLFTASMVGVALLVLVPTVFVTTVAAAILFTWALLAYWVFEWTRRTTTTIKAAGVERRRSQQQQQQQQVDHGVRHGQQNHSRRLPAAGQQTGDDNNTVAYDKNGSRPESDRTVKEKEKEKEKGDHNRDNDNGNKETYLSEDSATSRNMNMLYDMKAAAAAAAAAAEEKHKDQKPKGAVFSSSDQAMTPVKDGEEVFPLHQHQQPVLHTQNSAKQADYKACIAEDGAYVEVAPGLDTVHSIAITG